MQLLGVLVCNSANKPSFQSPTKLHFFHLWSVEQTGLFLDLEKSGLLAKLQARMSRSCRFFLFLPYEYQVSLNAITGSANDLTFLSSLTIRATTGGP